MTSDALPSRDIARPVLRVAFTAGWLIGALLVAALVATVANAAGLKERAPRAAGVGVGFVAEPTPEPAPVLAPGKH